MDQTPNATQRGPAQNKFPPIVRAIGIGVLVLILWSIDKVAVQYLPQVSIWRYIVGGVIISVGTGDGFISRRSARRQTIVKISVTRAAKSTTQSIRAIGDAHASW